MYIDNIYESKIKTMTTFQQEQLIQLEWDKIEQNNK